MERTFPPKKAKTAPKQKIQMHMNIDTKFFTKYKQIEFGNI